MWNESKGSRKKKTCVFYFIGRGRLYLLLDGGRAMLESLSEDIYCVGNVFAGTSYSLNNFVEQVNCDIE